MAIATRDLADVNTVIQSGQDRELLKLFREESATCALLVRVVNEQRKEEWRQRTDLERTVEAELDAVINSDQPLFGTMED